MSGNIRIEQTGTKPKRFTFDTYAWVEYFEGSDQGITVKNILEGGNVVFTPAIVAAELFELHQRKNFRTDWSEMAHILKTFSVVMNLNFEIAVNAAATKVNMRKTKKDFGLADAIVLESARTAGSVLVTGDPHLTALENVLDLRKF